MLEMPVVMLTFNRPDETRRVLERVREAAPRRLHVVSDGPRGPRDEEGVRATRALFDDVGWDCEVTRDYAPENMGCAVRIITGLDGAFERFPEALILEDDIVPDPSLFPFCAELLERYRDEPRVMMISGIRPDALEYRAETSYVFTRVAAISGWATWARAWDRFDRSHAYSSWFRFLERHRGLARWVRALERLPARIRRMAGGTGVREFDADPELLARIRSCGAYQTEGFRVAALNRAPGWGFPWGLTVLRADGLVASPMKNLITNIGFGGAATHSVDEDSPYADRPTEPMTFPLVHPERIEVDEEAQAHIARDIDRFTGTG